MALILHKTIGIVIAFSNKHTIKQKKKECF